jgi:nucleotide-binding universal stress UspA family protein
LVQHGDATVYGQKEGVAVKAFVMSGRPADAIIEVARDKNADLIVLGSHGRTDLKNSSWAAWLSG